MRYTLKEAFDSIFADVEFNSDLARALYNNRVSYMTGDRERMEFFGGNLLGVNVVHYKDVDVAAFYELFELSYHDVVSEVRQVTTIDHKYKVGSDVMNLTIMYCIHRFLNANISQNDKAQAAFDLGMIFFCRCAAILISANFRYPADPKVAQLAYGNLSQKYLIKRLGSWSKVMDYRTKALLDPKESPHAKTLRFFNEDVKIQYAVADSQGRVREMFKGYYSEFMMVHSEGGSIGTSSALVVDAEGDLAIREKTTGPETYVFYMREIISDKETFIRDDVLQMIARNNSNTSLRAVRAGLEWISFASTDPKQHELVDKFVSRTLVQMAHFMQNNIETSRHRDLAFVLSNLKNLFLSTRSNDPDLANIRELGEKIVNLSQADGMDPKKAPKISSSLMMATRTSLLMYICLRALIGKN